MKLPDWINKLDKNIPNWLQVILVLIIFAAIFAAINYARKL